MKYPLFSLLLLVPGISATAADPLDQNVAAALAGAAPGTRFGLVVVDEAGNEIVAIAPEQRFIPASNTKIFSTAVALATIEGVDRPDATGGASVRLDGEGRAVPDVILTGNGDARLSSAPDCAVNCLATLADAVAARARVVGNVIGDDSIFPDQRWGPGMSWNNIQSRYGTATSALTIDDNELVMEVRPADAAGKPPIAEMASYYRLDNRATTRPGEASLSSDRMPNSRELRLTGTIPLGAEPRTLRFSIDDPAHYAAWRLKQMLEARGVRVAGEVQARHRLLTPADDPEVRGAAPAPRPPQPEPLARLEPPPLFEDIKVVNKVSQNLHAELLLRRAGRVNGSGSIADGMVEVRKMLEKANVPRATWDLSDGSGMSTYNRVAPRGMVTLLRWISAQPWGEAFRETLPIGGIDGTLARRFKGTPLEGRIFAKTGSLNATNALAGYMIAASGRTLTFAIYANDVPEGASGTPAMDAALNAIAAAN